MRLDNRYNRGRTLGELMQAKLVLVAVCRRCKHEHVPQPQQPLWLLSQIEQVLSSVHDDGITVAVPFASFRCACTPSRTMQVKDNHEAKLVRVLGVAPPQPYERGADGKRSWWRRALELFGTFRRKHGDVLTREDVAEYRKQKAREELPITDPERHLGLRVSRLDDVAKGLVVDGDVELNDLGDNTEIKDGDSGAEVNTGYSILTPTDARNHERPNHLRLFQEGCEPRSFRDRHEDPEHIAYVRDLERRNRQATQGFLPRWNKGRSGTD